MFPNACRDWQELQNGSQWMTSPSSIVGVLLGFSSPIHKAGAGGNCVSFPVSIQGSNACAHPQKIWWSRLCEFDVGDWKHTARGGPNHPQESVPQAMGHNRNRQGAAEMALREREREEKEWGGHVYLQTLVKMPIWNTYICYTHSQNRKDINIDIHTERYALTHTNNPQSSNKP